MRKTYILLLTLMVIGAGSCKKKGIDKTITTIVNKIDQRITLDLYETAEAYGSNGTVKERFVIEPGQNLYIPGGTFEEGKVYYIDWYSEDYYHNNWYNDDYPVTGVGRVRISPEPTKNTYYLEPGYKGQARKAFIKGDGTETSWIAVGAYLYSSSKGYSNQWSVLSVDERYRQITIKKDFTATYMHKDGDGKLMTTSLPFMVQQSETPYIEFKNSVGGIAGNMIGGKSPAGTPPEYKTNSIDTVMALFPDNEYIFMMIRQ